MSELKSPSPPPKPNVKKGSFSAARKVHPELAELYRRVGSAIQEQQDRANLTQRQACKEIFGKESKQGEWSQWVRGRTLPNIATLHQIAAYFGVTLGSLGLYEPPSEVTRADLIRTRRESDRAIQRAQKAMEEALDGLVTSSSESRRPTS